MLFPRLTLQIYIQTKFFAILYKCVYLHMYYIESATSHLHNYKHVVPKKIKEYVANLQYFISIDKM